MPRQQRVVRHSYLSIKCQMYGRPSHGNIIKHGVFRLKRGTRRPYRCETCGQISCSTTGTGYHRIHRSRNIFDEVCNYQN